MFHTSTILALIFLFSLCFGSTITYTEIGVIEEQTNDQNENNNQNADTTYQEAVLRRRLMPGGLTDTDKLTILNAQNMYRNITAQGLTPNQPSATYMNQLVWDAGLAKVAQNYSAQCIWAHNPNRASQLRGYENITSFSYVNQYVGENLFISTGSENIDTILSGIEYWYKEYQSFTYGPITATGSECQSGQQCGHYTQLIWANTRYVGCGYTKCATVTNLPTFTNAIMFACDYYFAGNYVDDYPYVSGNSCSNCPADRKTCQDGLCSGCPSPSWDTYCCEYCSSSTCSNAISNGLCNSPSTCTNGISSNTTTTATKSPTTHSPTTTTTTTKSPTTTTTKSPTTTTTTTKSPTTASPTTTTTTKSPTTASPTTKSPTTAHPTTTTTTTKSPTTASPTTKSPTTASPTTKPPTASAEKLKESTSGCCLALNSANTSRCKSLSLVNCDISQLCYWNASC